MPKAKRLLTAFTPKEASALSGLTVATLNYLAQQNFLRPLHGRAGTRGKTRYYSYKDVVVARVVARLLQAGLEIKRLKKGIQMLSESSGWAKDGETLSMLATDGKNLFFVDPKGHLLDLTQGGQQAFAFVLDVEQAKREVQSVMPPDQLAGFTFKRRALQ